MRVPAALLALLLLVAAGCGKYGPPVRHTRTAPAAASTQTPANDERDDETEKTP